MNLIEEHITPMRDGGEVRAKKTSVTLNQGTNSLKLTSLLPPMNGLAGALLAWIGSHSGHPSKQQPRFILLDSYCDNCLAQYAASLDCCSWGGRGSVPLIAPQLRYCLQVCIL
ncbi:hypothetical protein J6590_020606 [Homalodisca vitripennis]|nr:hypothetical protein J6590_020606 [Homalodisca vitripennis]